MSPSGPPTIVLPADHDACGAVGHHTADVLLAGRIAYGDAPGQRRPIAVEPLRAQLIVAGHLLVPDDPRAAAAIRNGECEALHSGIGDDRRPLRAELHDTCAGHVLDPRFRIDGSTPASTLSRLRRRRPWRGSNPCSCSTEEHNSTPSVVHCGTPAALSFWAYRSTPNTSRASSHSSASPPPDSR